jgi:MoxR-like ATPase
MSREKFLDAAQSVFPTKSEFTRNELVQIANSIGMKYAPSWVVKDDTYKVRRGVFTLTPAAAQAGVQIAPKVIPMPEKKEVAKSIAVATTEIANLVPVKYDNYVPFGFFKDLKSIIASKQFYPTFVTGLSGNGKTMMVEQVCAQLKREFFRVNVTIETDEDDLLGGYRLQDGETVWFDGPVVQAMKKGAVLLLDEVDLASNKIMCLQPILEGKGVLLKKINQFVEPAEGFTIVATANTKGRGSDDGKFIGTNILNEAFLERFPITVEQEYPSVATEKKIILKEMASVGAVDEDFAENLIKWSDIIRKTYYEGGIDEIIATRRLVHIVKAFSMFKDRMKAIELCINRFDDETKTAFKDLYTKIDAEVGETDFDQSVENSDSEVPF